MATTQVNDQVTLESVRQQFSDWRASRSSKREQIPEGLWQAAVRLCQIHSINYVSRSLRLSYTALKKRVLGVHVTREKSVQFLQVGVGNPCFVQWQMECIRADGGRLQVSAAGALPSFGDLFQGFWS